MQGTDRINTITNIVFVLSDVLEYNLINMQEEFKKNGFELRHEVKRNFNAALYNIKKLRKEINHCRTETQENYGNDADMLNAIILTLIDRCGNEDILMWKFYEYVKSFPSQFQMVDDMDWAFSHIFEKKKDESK